MLEFSSETKQEQPDAGRMSLSEAKDAARDSGETSNKGGGGESGGSLNDLKMPSGENFREQGQIENRPEPMMDAKEGKSDAAAGEQTPENKGTGDENFREQEQIENRPESSMDSNRESNADKDEPGGYSDWRDSQFGQGSDARAEASPDADPDSDGRENREEFKDGTDARRAEKDVPRKTLTIRRQRYGICPSIQQTMP